MLIKLKLNKMGAWGYHSIDSDEYLDWKEDIFREAAIAIINRGREDVTFVAGFLYECGKEAMKKIKDAQLKKASLYLKEEATL